MPGGFPILADLCCGNAQGFDLANSRGTSVTAGSGSYGSYVQLVASTPNDTTWVILTVGTNGSVNTGNGAKFRLAVGAAASEVAIVSDIAFHMGNTGLHQYTYSFPLRIPAGSRVAVGAYGQAADAYYAAVTLFDAGYVEAGVSGYDAVGNSAYHGTSVAAGAANTKGSYVQLTASSSQDYCGLFVTFDAVGAANLSAQSIVDIAIGAAASEQVIIPNISCDGGSVGADFCTPFYPIPIPSGTRIAARFQCPAGSGNLGVTVMGALP